MIMDSKHKVDIKGFLVFSHTSTLFRIFLRHRCDVKSNFFSTRHVHSYHIILLCLSWNSWRCMRTILEVERWRKWEAVN